MDHKFQLHDYLINQNYQIWYITIKFQNMGLRQEVELLKKENHILREKLSKYADV